MLDHLVDEHLLIAVTGDRYRLHDLLRDYAVQTAYADEPDELRESAINRVLDFYLHTAARASRALQPRRVPLKLVGAEPAHAPRMSNEDVGRRWLEAEHANLVAAVTFAAEHDRPAWAWQLAESVQGYLSIHGYIEDWLQSHRVALDAAVAAHDQIGEAVMRTYLGGCYMFLDRGEEGLSHLFRALEMHRRSGDRNLEATVLGYLAYVCTRLGRFSEALDYTEQAVMLVAGNDFGREAMLREHAGLLLSIFGRYQEALENYEQAIALYRRTTFADLQMLADVCVGDVYRNMGRLDEAREHLARLVKDAVEHGTGPTLAHARHRLGKTYWDMGRLKHAAAELTEALNLVRTYGVAITESEILIDLGAVHRDSGHLDKATTLVNEGLTLAVTTNERYQHARALDGLASIHDHAGRATEAEDLWRRAYALFAELGTPEAIRIRARLRSSRSAEVRT